MDYHAVKQLHVACVIASISLFALRGGMHWKGIHWRRWLWLRITPHLNDTVLLGAALWLAFQLPEGAALDWILAKLVALVGYILLGKAALADSTPPALRLGYVTAALLCVAYIVGVALSKSPSLGLLAG